MVKDHSVNTGAVWKDLRFGTKTWDSYAGYKFRIISKFKKNTLVVPESTVLPLADRWTRAHCRPLLLPLALSSSSLPRAFPRFLHRRRLARRASRPYCGSAWRASCRRSVDSPRGPVHCRHCSLIRLRTPAIERRAALVDFAHRTTDLEL